VERPSARVRGIDSDLDNIVMMALRKEPVRRYASVDQFAEDIRRYLDARPVIARQDSFRYRAGKFVARNRAWLAAAVLFVAVLVTGAATSTIQARRADRERMAADGQRRIAEANQARAMSEQSAAEAAAQEAGRQRANAEEQRRQADLQKTVAETEKSLADRRFEQVRQLAGKFLLDFHDAIAALPGSTPARKMVVETGLQYYDSLVREANGNRDLLEEIARGYDRLGDVQGNTYYANLGDADGALASYRKALTIRRKVADDSPRFLSERIAGEVRIAQMLALKGDPAGATRTVREAVQSGESAAPAREVREALAGAYRAMGDMYFRSGAYDQSIGPYEKLLALWTEMAKEHKDPQAERIGVSLGNSKLGDALTRLYRGPEGVGHLRTAAAIDREIAEANPNSAPRLRQLYSDLAVLAVLFRRSPELAAEGEARKTAEEAAGMAEREYISDPNNSTSLFDMMVAQTLVGDWYRDHGDPEASVSYYRKAVDAVEKFASGKPPAQLTDDSLVYAHQRLAAGMGLSGQLEGALENVRRGEECLARMEARNPGSINNASRRGDLASTRGEAYAHREMWKEAVEDFVRATAILVDLRKRNPENGGHLEELAHVRSRLADCQAASGDWAPAAATMQLSLGDLSEIAASRPLHKDEETLRAANQLKLDRWRAHASR
jgi:tetratricopeptide (TPR) repeat protein